MIPIAGINHGIRTSQTRVFMEIQCREGYQEMSPEELKIIVNSYESKSWLSRASDRWDGTVKEEIVYTVAKKLLEEKTESRERPN